MRTAYRSVLSRRDVVSALVPYLLARLPLSMAALAILLLVRAETGSYHRAGFACAAYALAVAATAPLLGRMVDRRGQGVVLLGCGLLHPVFMLALALSAANHHFALAVLSAAAAGGCLPPVTGCMRALWSQLLLDESSRQVGFAIEGIIVEVAELTGPVLVTVALVLSQPSVAVIAAGALSGIAALLFRQSEPSKFAPATADVVRGWGALAVPGVRRLLLVVMGSTATIGAVEVAVAAFARHHGGTSTTGLYVALISVGGIVAGLVYGAADRVSGWRGPAMLGTLMLLTAASAATLAGTNPLPIAIGALFLFGAVVAVGVVVQLAIMSTITTEATRTEAFTWGGTANYVGLGVGTWVAGWAVDDHGVATAFLVAALPAVAAAAVAFTSGRAFRPAAPAAPAVATAEPAEPAVRNEPAVALSTPSDIQLPTTAATPSFPRQEPAMEEPVSTPVSLFDPILDYQPALAAALELAQERETGPIWLPVVQEEHAVIDADPAQTASDMRRLEGQLADSEAALEAVLLESPGALTLADARVRSQRMLERADAACLEMRERAEDDAARVRGAATAASLEILAAAERDARALLERARRQADVILAGARRAEPDVDDAGRPALHALPALSQTNVVPEPRRETR